jgi:aspartyl-tRNA(Asn)/glutamyl-tRNA(Gln) amidotransferase subunit C
MISREDVLHVATLSRLALTDEEADRYAGELSSVLDHIAMISTLDLDGVAPTAHVVQVDNALRADEPRESLPRHVLLDEAPAVADGGFLVPSPQAS